MRNCSVAMPTSDTTSQDPAVLMCQLEEVSANTGNASASSMPSSLALEAIEAIPELFQPRNGMSEKHISDLAKAIENFGELEPILVFRAGSRNIVIDGHHRLEAYRVAKHADAVPVRFFSGSVADAVLEAGSANTKVKLPMSSAERQDFAWRLVVVGKYTKPDIARASGTSTSQVGVMRSARTKLGDEASSYARWWEARKAANGVSDQMSDDDREQWKEQEAQRYADQLAEMFSTRFARHPEIAARALDTYFGRMLPQLFAELRGYVSEEEAAEGDDEDNDEF